SNEQQTIKLHRLPLLLQSLKLLLYLINGTHPFDDHISIHLSIYPSNSSIYPFIFLSFYPSIPLSFYPFYSSINLSNHLFHINPFFFFNINIVKCFQAGDLL
ncbi:hypothetical protein LOAG_11261, partial [Loa loa]